jgi:uncharacterized protein
MGPTVQLAEKKLMRDPRLQREHVNRELLAYIVEKIVQGVAPQRIILFGSQARGDASQTSDVDLLIVQDSDLSNREMRRQIEYLLWGRRFGVDLIVRRPEEVQRNVDDDNPFYTYHILEEGQVLYERPA